MEQNGGGADCLPGCERCVSDVPGCRRPGCWAETQKRETCVSWLSPKRRNAKRSRLRRGQNAENTKTQNAV